jgi:hypothetical protein
MFSSLSSTIRTFFDIASIAPELQLTSKPAGGIPAIHWQDHPDSAHDILNQLFINGRNRGKTALIASRAPIFAIHAKLEINADDLSRSKCKKMTHGVRVSGNLRA